MNLDLNKFNIKSGLNTNKLSTIETINGKEVSKNYAANMTILGNKIGGLFNEKEASIFNATIRECAGDNILDEAEAQIAMKKLDFKGNIKQFFELLNKITNFSNVIDSTTTNENDETVVKYNNNGNIAEERFNSSEEEIGGLMTDNSTFQTTLKENEVERIVTTQSGLKTTYKYNEFGKCTSYFNDNVSVEFDENGNSIEKYSNGETWHKNKEGIYTHGEGKYTKQCCNWDIGANKKFYENYKQSIKEKEFSFTTDYNKETKTLVRKDTMGSINFERGYDLNNRLLYREQNGYKSEFIYDENGNDKSIKITDTKTGKEKFLYLNKFTQNYNDEDKRKIIDALKDVPPEALMDLNTEVTGFLSEGSNAAGGYVYMNDSVYINPDHISAETIIHELGHAIDATYNNNYNLLSTKNNSELQKIFENELKQYKKIGPVATTSIDINGDPSTTKAPYCTTNLQEMFAECYTTLMLGYTTNSGDIINQHFPLTMAAIKKIIQNTRTLPDNIRHQS